MTIASYLYKYYVRRKMEEETRPDVFSEDTAKYLNHVPTTISEKIAHFLHSNACHVSTVRSCL